MLPLVRCAVLRNEAVARSAETDCPRQLRIGYRGNLHAGMRNLDGVTPELAEVS